MKGTAIGFLLIGILTVLNGCEPSKPDGAAKPPPDSDSDTNKHPKYQVPDTFREAVSKILSPYFEVHSALAQDDFQKAKNTSKNISESVAKAEKLDTTSLEESTREAWLNNIKDLRLATNKISDAEDMKKARQYFAVLSDKLIILVRNFGHDENEAVQLLRCGMAFDGAGAYWLQRNKNELVRNPYFGAEMLECGQKISLLNGKKVG